MNARDFVNRRRRAGIVYILALLLLAVSTALAAALATTANMNLQAGNNQMKIVDARMAAEGGLSYVCYLLENEPISGSTDAEILDSIADLLRPALEGPGKLPPGSITSDSQSVLVPTVSVSGMSGTFSVAIAMMADSTVSLAISGQSGAARRVAGIRMEVQGGLGDVFANGIVTNGPIQISGNGKLRGVNNPSEAKVYSAATRNPVFNLSGNSYIEGDVFATNPSGTISLSGNSKIAGCRNGDPELSDHVHMGVDPFELPEVDASPFVPLATNIVDASTPVSGNFSMSNIRIVAGRNPHFSGNYTLRGVIYIESPNMVTFSGNTIIAGIIITEDAGDNAYITNRIDFQGNTTLNGADSLPDLPEYAALKALPGSMILAPGFGLDFHGNFGTISGCMAADQFSFHGNCSGTMKGTILNYGQTEMIFQGNSTFYFDLADSVENPAGFTSGTPVLVIVPMSYTES